jgi:large subunit ribosomal protein L28
MTGAGHGRVHHETLARATHAVLRVSFALRSWCMLPSLSFQTKKGVSTRAPGAIVRRRCEICGKGVAFGHNVSHSNRKTNRDWRPNVQKTTMMVAGQARRIVACTACIRTIQKHATA